MAADEYYRVYKDNSHVVPSADGRSRVLSLLAFQLSNLDRPPNGLSVRKSEIDFCCDSLEHQGLKAKCKGVGCFPDILDQLGLTAQQKQNDPNGYEILGIPHQDDDQSKWQVVARRLAERSRICDCPYIPD